MPRPNDLLDVFKRAQAATIRTLAADPGLDVRFGSGDAGKSRRQEYVSLPRSGAGASGIAVVRGTGDHLAFRHRYHDRQLHQRFLPQENPARNVFEWIEDARISAIGAALLPGVAVNLDAVLESRFKEAFLDTVSCKNSAPLEIAIGLLVREKLCSHPLPPVAENIARFWREEVQALAGCMLERLRECLFDQERYAGQVKQMLAVLGFACSPDHKEPLALAGQDEEEEIQASAAGEPHPDHAGNQQNNQPAAAGGERILAASSHAPASSSATAAFMPDDRTHPAAHTFEEGYRVFTREFDKIVGADALCDSGELDQLRAQLDQKLAAVRVDYLKLANRLQRQLLARQKCNWSGNLEEGLLDTARLASIITEGMQACAFKQEQDAAAHGTVLTMLIDSSGSMRGNPIAAAAICADILGRTLERCSVKVEILGFSTQDWRGGRARQRWTASGQPAQPGRLNDLLHVIYKSADEPWRKGRRRLGLLIREEFLKENIDGEALLWAHERLLSRSEPRRILMVISDGMPADTSTRQENGDTYLEQHLRYAIDRIENRSPVELVAIGIGHDVTRYYRHAVTIRDASQLGIAMASRLAALFESPLSIQRKTAGFFSGRRAEAC